MFKIICLPLSLILCVGVAAQSFAQCSEMVKAEDNGLLSRNGQPLGPAVIFNAPESIPELHLRFVDAKSGKRVVPTQVTVTYPWKWLEYPYPEHLWGAWSDAYDLLKCTPSQNEEELIIPAYKLVPRGWYKGKYTGFPWSRKPKFDGIGINIEETQCTSGFGIKKSDLRRYEKAVAIIKLSCSADPQVRFTNQ